MALIVPGILVAMGFLAALLAGWRWLRDPPRRLCPGPRLPWLHVMFPLWWVYRPRCGYDLTGHPVRSGCAIICPECGRSIEHRRELLRSSRRWRPAILALVLLGAAALIHRHPPLAAVTIAAYTPSDVLLHGERILENIAGVRLPEVRAEIHRRAAAAEFNQRQTRAFARLLINDLRNDGVPGNATEALQQLSMFAWSHPEPLIVALDSSDSQQRRMAAAALRDVPWDPNDPLLDRLVKLAIDDLCDDDVSGNATDARSYLAAHVERAKPLLLSALSSDDVQLRRHALTLLRRAHLEGASLELMLRLNIRDLACDRDRRTAEDAFDFLLRHVEPAEPMLRLAMMEGDARQRLLSAAVAGCAGRVDLLELAVPILVAHLADNAIDGDGIVAARALWGFQHAVLPYLEPYRRSDDPQQRQCVEYIVQRMTTDRSIASLQRELPLARLTRGRVDAFSYEPSALRVPWMRDEP